MKAVQVTVLTLVGILGTCPLARADLGNCLVLRHCNDEPEQCECGKDVIARYIRNAYAVSSHAAEDMVFVLDVTPRLPPGAYEIWKAKLVLGETWVLRGYRIGARDLEGMMNGAVEVRKAFEGGRIEDLKTGRRDGLVTEPQYGEK